MPSRTVTLVVVVFWLGVAAWMVCRDHVREPDRPPTFAFEPAEEVGTYDAMWKVWFRGQTVGLCRTALKRQ